MQEMIVYTVAIVVAVMIMFMLFSLRLDGDRTSIEVTRYYAAKDRSLDLATLLERDLRNIAGNMPSSNCGFTGAFNFDPDTAFVAFDTTKTKRVFSFYAQTDSCQTVPRVVTYEWEPNNTVKLKSGTVDVFDVVRRIEGTTDVTSYPDLVTDLTFEFLKSDGTGVFNLLSNNDARQINVQMRMISPLGAGDTVEEVAWEAVVRPYSLTRNDWGF